MTFTFDLAATEGIPADWDGGKEFKVNAYDSAMNKTTAEVDLNVLKAKL